jgi:hypothetical protein
MGAVCRITTLLSFLFLAQTAAAFDLATWLKNPPYQNGGTIQEQIQCYALPFGAIGMVSHVLTYLTVICLASGRSPLMPWKKLGHKKLNITFAMLGLCISFPMAVLTMVRCRNSWAFILIAVWKVTLSFTLSVMTIHAARLIEPSIQYARSVFTGHAADRYYAPPPPDHYKSADNVALLADGEPSTEYATRSAKSRRQFRDIWWWLFFYFLGSIVGFTGVMDLVKNHLADPNMGQLRTVTYVFVGVSGGLTLLALVFACLGTCSSGSSAFSNMVAVSGLTLLFSLIVLTVLFAFYTDWVLATLDGDILGYPSSDNAVFYWAYFAAKRVPMLSL